MNFEVYIFCSGSYWNAKNQNIGILVTFNIIREKNRKKNEKFESLSKEEIGILKFWAPENF